MSNFKYSNFQLLEVPLEFEGIVYHTVENFFQAMKTLDHSSRKLISEVTPGQSKKFGKTLILRPDWEQLKEQVMLYALRWKMFPNERLTRFGHQLIDDQQKIIELNYWHDNYWGSCTCNRCGNKGKNRLGKLLMTLRDELISMMVD